MMLELCSRRAVASSNACLDRMFACACAWTRLLCRGVRKSSLSSMPMQGKQFVVMVTAAATCYGGFAHGDILR